MPGVPWLSILGAWSGFGSYAVPMKWRSVSDARVHPLVYQSHKTFWVFVSSHITLLDVDYEFSWWGVVSGFLWVPAGVASVVAVRSIGIAYGQAIWQIAMVISALVWGFLILDDERVRSWSFTGLGVFCMLGGITGMTFSANGRRGHCDAAPRLLEAEEQSSVAARQPQRREPLAVLRGVAASLFVGLWGGACLLPSALAPVHGAHFAISFGTGALIANLALWLIYAVLIRSCWKQPLPALELRVMMLPGFLSGTLWSLGNICSLRCVAMLGQGIGAALSQPSVIVSGLWGILYYQEIAGRQALLWWLCCCFCMAGVLLLSQEDQRQH